MSTVYQVGIHLSAVNGISPVLNQIANQLRGLQSHTLQLNATMKTLGHTMAGTFAAVAGHKMFSVLHDSLDAAKKLSHEFSNIKKLGIDQKQYGEVVGASRALQASMPGVSEKDAGKTYGSLYSIFGHEDSLKMLPEIAKNAAVLGNAMGNPNSGFDEIYKMIRAGDLMGKFVNHDTHKVDTDKLREFLDLGTKAIIGSHGMVKPDTWLGMAQQGGPALGGMSNDGLLSMAIVAQMMGGQRAGTALSSLYQQFIGGTTTQRTAEEMKKTGMISNYDVMKGGAVRIRDEYKNPEYKKLMQEDMIGFTKKLVEDWKKAGKSTEQMVESLYTLFGRQTTQRLIHDLLRNLPQIEAERERWKGAMTTDQAYNQQNKEDISQNLSNMHKAWEGLMATMGNSKWVIDVLQNLTSAFTRMNAVMQENPGTVAFIGQAATAIAAALVALGGAVVIAAATAIVGPVAAAAVAVGTIVMTLAALNWEGVKSVLDGILNALKSFIAGLAGIPAAIGNIVSGIAGAAKAGPGGATVPNPNGSGAGGLGGSIAPELPLIPKPRAMNFSPPPGAGDRPVQVHASLNVDGQTLARSTSTHMARMMEHPTSAPFHDAGRGYAAPDAQYSVG